MKNNCEFHCFKPFGKWYSSSRGVLLPSVYDVFKTEERRAAILECNGGEFPGLAGNGQYFIWIVLPDEHLDFGYPLLLKPKLEITP